MNKENALPVQTTEERFSVIDMKSYPRRDHYRYFKTLPYPYVGTTVDVDVTDLVNACRENGRSFYLLFLHAAALAADRVPELRQRISGDGIIEYEACPTSHIELLEDGTYCYCTLHHHMPMPEYIRYAEKARAESRAGRSIQEDENVMSMYFISALPWLHYTSVIQPVACGDESNPRITWGKFEADCNGRLQMPVTVLVHHALADGIHLAAFYRNLSEEIRSAACSE